MLDVRLRLVKEWKFTKTNTWKLLTSSITVLLEFLLLHPRLEADGEPPSFHLYGSPPIIELGIQIGHNIFPDVMLLFIWNAKIFEAAS